MSLGGYKFAGRYCQKGSLTDAQWALLMHKTKVAAFMAANTRASAGWEYDMTGSPDGNIHCLDTVGNNYVTCFKRVVDESTTHYFCILTLTKYTQRDASTGEIVVTRFAFRASNYYFGGGTNTAFIRFAVNARFSYDTCHSAWTAGQSLLLPVGNLGYNSNSWSTTSTKTLNVTTYSYLALETLYFGFAVKGSDIVMFSGPSRNGCAVSICSCDAFSAKFAEDTSPLKNGLFINPQSWSTSNSSNGESASGYWGSYDRTLVYATGSGSGGNTYDGQAKIVCGGLTWYSGSMQAYPFQNMNVVTYKKNQNTNTYAKGVIKTELISMNTPPSTAYPNMFTTTANGKYLVIYGYVPNDSIRLGANLDFEDAATFNSRNCLYVGWDPSNPDITQASSWTEYTD